MFCENSKCVLAGVSIKNRNLSNSPIQCVNEKTLAQSNIELESAIRQRLIDKALARKNHFTKLHPNDVSSSGKNSDVSNFDKNSNFRNPITTNDSASSKKPPWWHLSPSQPSALPPSNGIPFHELSNEHPAAILTASSAVPKGSTKRSGADLTGERWKLLKKFPDITSAPLTFRANATPVIPNKLEQMLSQHPNREFANYIVDIIRNGANLRTTNFIPDRIRIRKNLKSAIDHKTRIHSYLRAETAAGRIAGPFPSPDIHPCIQYWPFGVVEKKGYHIDIKGRVIINFSSVSPDHPDSLNASIEQPDKDIKYARIVDAIDAINKLKKFNSQVTLASVDVKHAFRLIPVAAQNLHLQGLSFPNEDGVTQYYFDRVLGFGASSSCAIFGDFSNAIHWITTQKINKKLPDNNVILQHYADDFLIIASDPESARIAFEILQAVLAELGIPAAPDKLSPPCTNLTYLGIILDTHNMLVAVPTEKRASMARTLRHLSRKTNSLWDPHDTASIVGKLQAARVCFPSLFPHVGAFYKYFCPALRQDRGFVPGKEIFPFCNIIADVLDTNPTTNFSAFEANLFNADVTILTDAAGRLGAGAVATNGLGENEALHCGWPLGYTMDDDLISSGFLELAAIYIALKSFKHHSRMNVWTDSTNAVNSLNKGFSHKKLVNHATKLILEFCAKNKITLLTIWHARDTLTGKVADAMSRNDFFQVSQLMPQVSSAQPLQLDPHDFQIFNKSPI